MIEEQIYVCENPACSQTFRIVKDPQRGHRRRQYCSDRCKSAMFRERQLEQKRRADEEAARRMDAEERDVLRCRYGEDLLPGTIALLQTLSHRYPSPDIVAIAQVIREEVNRVSVAHAEDERSRLAQAMMDLGEPDFHSIMVENQFVVLGGRSIWQSFVEKASTQHLQAIYDCYIAPVFQAPQHRVGGQS